MPNLLLVILLMLPALLNAQRQVGVEHYYFTHQEPGASFIPMLHLQSKKNWYAEVRYNYEDSETASFNFGKKFRGEGKINYELTPLVGVLFGNSKGGTLGTKVELSLGSFSFCSEPLYFFSAQGAAENYFFNWSEITFSPTDYLYGGLSLQQTKLVGVPNLFEPGIVIGGSFKNFTLPVYGFNLTSSNRYFVIGLIWKKS